jgi:RHS repeat-associated protein
MLSVSADTTGRIYQLGNWNYTWNEHNNLTGAQLAGNAATQFYYDPNNGLVAQQTGSDLTTWLRDAQNKALVTTTDATINHIWFNGKTVAKAHSHSDNNYIEYIFSDLTHNPVLATDENGDDLWRKNYDPYGNEGQTSGDHTSLTFHQNDAIADAGLVYIGARWYSPELRRFISPDPVGVPDSGTVGVNRFHYGLDNPVSYFDPDGNNAVTLVGGLMTETYHWATGNGFDSSMLAGALKDGYDGEGAGFAKSAADDALTFVPLGAVAGAAGKAVRVARGAKVAKVTKSPASRLADKAQGLPSSQRPNTVAVIKHKDGTVTVGRNQGGYQNPTVQNALDNAPANCFAGQCAEINALSRALNKGKSLDGATISVSNVRGAGSTSGIHGTPKAPCTTCSSVLDQLEVKYTQ